MLVRGFAGPQVLDGPRTRAAIFRNRVGTMPRACLLLFSVATSLALMACDSGSRPIAGRFRIRQVATGPDTAYYLWDTARPENEVSANGPVLRVGSDEHKLVALFAPPTSIRGFSAGWTVFDLNGNTHSAAMTDEEHRRDATVAGIVTYRADSSWIREKGRWMSRW